MYFRKELLDFSHPMRRKFCLQKALVRNFTPVFEKPLDFIWTWDLHKREQFLKYFIMKWPNLFYVLRCGKIQFICPKVWQYRENAMLAPAQNWIYFVIGSDWLTQNLQKNSANQISRNPRYVIKTPSI